MTILLLFLLGGAAFASIVATIVVTLRDGYRRIPTRLPQ